MPHYTFQHMSEEEFVASRMRLRHPQPDIAEIKTAYFNDTATVQWRKPPCGAWKDLRPFNWRADNSPSSKVGWLAHIEYRIKPQEQDMPAQQPAAQPESVWRNVNNLEAKSMCERGHAVRYRLPTASNPRHRTWTFVHSVGACAWRESVTMGGPFEYQVECSDILPVSESLSTSELPPVAQPIKPRNMAGGSFAVIIASSPARHVGAIVMRPHLGVSLNDRLIVVHSPKNATEVGFSWIVSSSSADDLLVRPISFNLEGVE